MNFFIIYFFSKDFDNKGVFISNINRKVVWGTKECWNGLLYEVFITKYKYTGNNMGLS